MATVDTKPAQVSTQTTSLPIDLRSIQDFTVPVPIITNPVLSQTTVGIPANVIRQAMTIGDPSVAIRTAQVVRTAAVGNENALAVALVPGAQDLQEIKELLFLILQQLTRNGVVAGAAPITQMSIDTGEF